MTKTIVILGAGLAGLPLAHHLVSRTAPNHPDLRIVLVSPHTHFYWGLASVRFVLPTSEHSIPEDRYLFPIESQFAGYPHSASQFEFVAGAAKQLHPDQNTVTVALNDGTERQVVYHTLVVATGTSYVDGAPWKALGSAEETRAAIADLRTKIASASSIVVAGAGATGVEFAGELGAAYSKSGKKKITLLSTDVLPLEPRLKESVRQTAKKELEKLGVEYIGNARVVSSSTPPSTSSGKKEITITVTSGGKETSKTLTADLLIPTYGAKPNTSFAPSSLLSPSSPGRLLQDTTLRMPSHRNIFVLGDAGALEPPQAVYADRQVRHLMTHFSSYLLSGTVAPYIVDPKVMYGVTFGPSRGVGQMGGFQIPSLLIWWIKGRYLGTDRAGNWPAVGSTNGAWPK
ncbi:FAD/NAD(P)-binding domain-containing protein [Annulohypoxylon maeteangense]|uniref:FAD/NAD(P)-binding domain-containing protein n=1 Tax=Annulohypoxylon maeteangense TaxID=1927788 RepID=UPI00200884D0|nr:FAD/NAD(P)-binding domain-containing protein [Annulohypoxylon maeteangense]KAI0885135.1 FAD/NAD(P)-binding domain-containing protein [Annulohypoxylon maeteangense]